MELAIGYVAIIVHTALATANFILGFIKTLVVPILTRRRDFQLEPTASSRQPSLPKLLRTFDIGRGACELGRLLRPEVRR